MNIARLNLGLANFRSAFFIINGSIAAAEQAHIARDVARAEPTTSILHTSKKKVRSPSVSRLETIFMTILVFTKPLILR